MKPIEEMRFDSTTFTYKRRYRASDGCIVDLHIDPLIDWRAETGISIDEQFLQLNHHPHERNRELHVNKN